MSNPVIVSLNGDIQRQGIKLNIEDWMDMGSKTWAGTSAQAKAAAYQAAKVAGWQDTGLLKLMVSTWGPRVDEDQAKFTLEFLQDLAKLHPLAVEVLKKDEPKPPVFKVKGCEKTIPFPSETKLETTDSVG
jgi:hypothetical protein